MKKQVKVEEGLLKIVIERPLTPRGIKYRRSSLKGYINRLNQKISVLEAELAELKEKRALAMKELEALNTPEINEILSEYEKKRRKKGK